MILEFDAGDFKEQQSDSSDFRKCLSIMKPDFSMHLYPIKRFILLVEIQNGGLTQKMSGTHNYSFYTC
jgi:hypothetical protein